MPIKKRNVFDELIVGFEDLKAQREGKKTLSTTTLPEARLPPFSPAQLKQLRERLGYSQPVFAALLHVKPATLKNWEQGKSTPNNEAQVLLRLVESNPEHILGELSKIC